MNREKQQNSAHIFLDIGYLTSRIFRVLFVILMCAMIIGIGAYIILDTYMQDTYTTNIQLTVLPRDNNPNKLEDRNIDTAIGRNINVLNSEIFEEKIKKSEVTRGIKGDVEAVQVPGTNLISLNATSVSAENAFRFLKAATKSYPELAGYFESGYVVKNLNGFSVDNIIKNQSSPLKYACVAAVLVLMAGVGLTVLITIFSDKIYSREQAVNLLDIDILGVLHRVKKRKGQKGLLISDPMADPSFIEEMDRLATYFQQKMDCRGLKTVIISSIHENEGKTTLAANLALSLAVRGKKVALIDGDLRKPSMAKIFEKQVQEGSSVSDLLEGKVALKEVMKHSKRYKGLIYVWQKQPVPEADQLLSNGRLKSVLHVFQKHVDYVIIDTPPIGIVRDTEILAGTAEAVILSVKQSGEKAAVLNDVTDLLEETGTTVIGGVINMAQGTDSRRKHRYGKYYYGYGNRRNGDK